MNRVDRRSFTLISDGYEDFLPERHLILVPIIYVNFSTCRPMVLHVGR